mmetsp:Transcript_9594/g.12546  ORF Transcript_9594/g.12546 Transcript_9594/m.12546 type:complete len:247 (+) Transcript_9594:103-843(+)
MAKYIAFVATLNMGVKAFVPSTGLNTGVKSTSALQMVEKSKALPMDPYPEGLDGTLPGDVGFDPAGFANNPPKPWLIGGEGNSLAWYREAELAHARVAMLAVLGWITPEFYHFPGNEDVGLDAFAETNPFKALSSVPAAGLWQISAAIFAIEFWRIKNVIRGDREPGDLNLGQKGDINPFGFNYDDEEYFAMQTREIKNGRLAMVAIIGMFLQCNVTGKGLISQLGGAFTYPEAVAKAGYYFPEGL